MATKTADFLLSDALGLARLVVDGAAGVTSLVEHVHKSIIDAPGLRGCATADRRRRATRLPRRARRLSLDGRGPRRAAALLDAGPHDQPVSREREIALAVLNGIFGDHLAETGNPLALEMRFRCNGRALKLDRDARRGLSRRDRQGRRARARTLHERPPVDAAEPQPWRCAAANCSYTPAYLSYNSGLHISVNGRAFADALEALVAAWPVEIVDLVVIGHSMGGLVARSACAYGEQAGHRWRDQLHKLIFLGTPHQGAPIERIGNWVDAALGKTPYAAPFARLGQIRSAGVTDLRYGNLLDEDWKGRDRFEREPNGAAPFRFPNGQPATRSPPRGRRLPPASSTAWSAMAWSRRRARSAATRIPRGRCGSRWTGNGSRPRRGTSTC